MDQQPVVYVIDDDPRARMALVGIVESLGLNVVACADAKEFLSCQTMNWPSCLVTDLRMDGMSGLDLLLHLKASDRMIPTIIVTGYPEMPVAVDAMLAGAVTFLEKTAPPQKICDAVIQALTQSRQQLARRLERERIAEIWNAINSEERQILQLVAQGKLNREIAFEIGVPLRTIEDRRRRLMTKIGAVSIVDLIRFAVRLEELNQSGEFTSLP